MSARVSRSNRIAQPSTPPVNMPSAKKLSRRKGGSKAPTWRAAISAAAAQERPARFGFFGHSHVTGIGAGTGTNALTGARALSYVGKMPAALAALGVAAEEQSFWGDGNVTGVSATVPNYDPRITLGSGWVARTTLDTFGARFFTANAGSTGTLDFQPGYAFESVTVWWPSAAGLSTALEVYVDDVLVQTINQVGAAGIVATEIAAPGSKVSLKNAAGSGTAFVQSVNGNRPVDARIIRGGWCSGRITNLTATSPAWSYLNHVKALDVDVGTVNCMANDILGAVPAATWKTNAKTLIQEIQVTGTAILIIDIPIFSTDGANAALYAQYVTAAQEIASETGCKLLDLRPLFGGSYAAASAAGLMYDANHFNALGAQVVATALAAM